MVGRDRGALVAVALAVALIAAQRVRERRRPVRARARPRADADRQREPALQPREAQILSPKNGQLVRGTTVEMKVSLKDATIVPATTTDIVPDEGHLHVILDDQLISMTGDTSQLLANLTPGQHLLKVEFVASRPRAVRPAGDRGGRVRGAAVSGAPTARIAARGRTCGSRSRSWPGSACCSSASRSCRRRRDPGRAPRAPSSRRSSWPRSWCPWHAGRRPAAPGDRGRRRPRGRRDGRPRRRAPGRRAARRVGAPARAPRRRRRGGAVPPGGATAGSRASEPRSPSSAPRCCSPRSTCRSTAWRRSPSTWAPGSCSRGSDGPRAPGPSPRHPCRGQRAGGGASMISGSRALALLPRRWWRAACTRGDAHRRVRVGAVYPLSGSQGPGRHRRAPRRPARRRPREPGRRHRRPAHRDRLGRHVRAPTRRAARSTSCTPPASTSCSAATAARSRRPPP